MNIFLWVLQGVLAAHTIMGAVWKYSNPAQIPPSLKAIPRKAWLVICVIEVFCALGLVIPTLAPISAALIGFEMLVFSGLHLKSGEKNRSPIIYWLVVAALSAVVAYGRC